MQWRIEFCTSAAVSSETVLDQYRTLIGNRTRRMLGLQVDREGRFQHTAPVLDFSRRSDSYIYIRLTENRVRNVSNSALSIVYNGSHVAQSQHLLSFSFSPLG